MAEVSLIILRYPDETIAFQRRDGNTQYSPHKLGLFGGHLEPAESAAEAARREFGEETSIEVQGRSFLHLLSVTVPEGEASGPDEMEAHLYETAIPDEPFEVFEGVGSERYTLDEALAREDLAKTGRYVLTRYIEEQ